MLLLAMGLTMNVIFCSNYNLYNLLDKTTVSETWAISEHSVSNEESGDTETKTKNLWPIPVIAAIPKGLSQLLFLIIVFLFYLSTLFILLPDEWTLVNQKVRMDD